MFHPTSRDQPGPGEAPKNVRVEDINPKEGREEDGVEEG